MGEQSNAAPPLVIVGLNHRSAGADLRDRVLVEGTDQDDIYQGLAAAGLTGALLLATCDRIEVHALADADAATAEAVIDVLADRARLDRADLATAAYTHRGTAAIRHLYAVAAALDSLVIGEPFVLGQLKEAHRRAAAAGMMAPAHERLLQAAYAVAKRVRGETRVGEGPVSLAAAAVSVARDIHGDLGARSGLVIGDHEMGALVARQLREAGLGRLVVSHRSAARAEALARTLAANHATLASLDEGLAEADIVISCVGLGDYVLTPDRLTRALERRRRRPIFVLDLAVPPDTAPGVERLDDVFLFATHDLERVAEAGRAEREAAAAAAWRIVDEAVAALLKERSMRGAVPAVYALRSRFEAERRRALAEAGGDARAATRLLINRLLHGPSVALREIAAGDHAGGIDRDTAEAVIRRLFAPENDKSDDMDDTGSGS